MTITQIAQKLNRERDAIIYRLPRLGINPDDRQVRQTSRPESEESPTKRFGTVKAPPILLIIIILIVAAFFIFLLLNRSQAGNNPSYISISNGSFASIPSGSSPYLSQSQLFAIYGIGSWGVLNTSGIGSVKEIFNGSALNSFISQGSNVTANFSVPQIRFTFNTTVQNATVGNSHAIKFNVIRNGKPQLFLIEEVLTSPQASYIFVSQSQLATNQGYINGMQYFIVGNSEVVANKDNYIAVFRCEYALCTNQTINETITAISKDTI